MDLILASSKFPYQLDSFDNHGNFNPWVRLDVVSYKDFIALAHSRQTMKFMSYE